MQLMGKETAINLSKLDFKFIEELFFLRNKISINLSKLDFKYISTYEKLGNKFL